MFARTAFSTSTSETARKKGYENSQSCQDDKAYLCTKHGLCHSKLHFKFAESRFKITTTKLVFSESRHLREFESDLGNFIPCVVLEKLAIKVISAGISPLVTILTKTSNRPRTGKDIRYEIGTIL